MCDLKTIIAMRYDYDFDDNVPNLFSSLVHPSDFVVTVRNLDDVPHIVQGGEQTLI